MLERALLDGARPAGMSHRADLVGGPGRRLLALAPPAIVFAVWRAVHALVVLAAGGAPVNTAFTYDATYYLAIIRHGYVIIDPTYRLPQPIAFFPGFPLVAAPVVAVLGVGIGGTVIANALALGSFVTVWGAARRWYDERIATIAVITLACWPGSLYLWAFYSEGLFVTVTAGALWADRAGRFRLAVALVFVAALTRSPGLLLGPVLAAAHLWSADPRWPGASLRRRIDPVAVAYLAAAAAGLAALLLIGRVVAGDLLAFPNAQRAWGRQLSAPWVPVVDGFRHIIDELPRLAGETTMNVVTTVALLALGVGGLVVARRRGAEDAPVAPPLWTLAATVMPQLTLLLTSMVRLALGAWTAFVLAAWLLRDRLVLRVMLWAVTAAASVVLLVRVAQGTFVA